MGGKVRNRYTFTVYSDITQEEYDEVLNTLTSLRDKQKEREQEEWVRLEKQAEYSKRNLAAF